MQCKICGCRDAQCPGGCFWVSDSKCSRCLLDQFFQLAAMLSDDVKWRLVGDLLARTGELRLTVGQLTETAARAMGRGAGWLDDSVEHPPKASEQDL